MSRAGAVALAVVIVGGCASPGGLGRIFEPDVYRVRPGDTLHSIAWRYQLDPDALARWNGIENPRTLQVGRRLRLRPPEGEPSDPASEVTAASETPDEREGDRDDASASLNGAGKAAGTGQDAGPGEWRWPADGEVVGTFGDGRVAGRGIDIAGKVGQTVAATRTGEVVYSGDGLKAYGRLIIIRHAGDFLSAYAHNAELLVDEGQRVERGQAIARMGASRDGTALLHFEIRDAGQPVDPRDYLPPRQ
jgi:lipoprotein NlpD